MTTPSTYDCRFGDSAPTPKLSQAQGSSTTMYAAIPAAVRSRIPFIRSSRYTTNAPSPPLERSNSYTSDQYLERRSSRSSTESATSTPSQPSTPEGVEITAFTGVEEAHETMNISLRQKTIGDIDWESAFLGLQIGQAAVRRVPSNTKATTLREMYLDAVRYMVTALPADMTDSEVYRLKQAMPTTLNRSENDAAPGFECNNAIRRATAQCIHGIIALIFLFLPLLTNILDRALRYEREHRLTERAMQTSVEKIKTLGEQGVNVSEAFGRVRRSVTGTVCFGILVWLFQSITAGVSDGVAISFVENQKSLRRGERLQI